MSWKQPINTDIFEKDEFDAFDRSVWFEIIGRCRNEDGPLPPFWHGNKRMVVSLERGSMVFRVSQFAREQGVDRKRVKKSIEKLSKWYNELHIVRKPYGCIVKVKNYNEIVKMHNEKDIERTTKGQRKDNERSTSNKSVESVKKSPNGDSGLKASKEYGKPEINRMLEALKGKIGIDAFVDFKIERNMAKHCVTLLKKIGKDEFVRRLDIILGDNFKRKNCNRIKFLYHEIKGFIEPVNSIKSF